MENRWKYMLLSHVISEIMFKCIETYLTFQILSCVLSIFLCRWECMSVEDRETTPNGPSAQSCRVSVLCMATKGLHRNSYPVFLLPLQSIRPPSRNERGVTRCSHSSQHIAPPSASLDRNIRYNHPFIDSSLWHQSIQNTSEKDKNELKM